MYIHKHTIQIIKQISLFLGKVTSLTFEFGENNTQMENKKSEAYRLSKQQIMVVKTSINQLKSLRDNQKQWGMINIIKSIGKNDHEEF
ncbi:unnamed protein product [Paramecium octaurelia]|uniref:Uncharacterized protein n=1 Tax=Paramecium octaurelia TaxID=43137 RepID=A0A8S1XRE8_PAROT|nr:unnamed protein product [Paramecium octaurelia]